MTHEVRETSWASFTAAVAKAINEGGEVTIHEPVGGGYAATVVTHPAGTNE